MLGSMILEVMIGLTFVYLILSLACSAIKEVIARLFDLRARDLEKRIKKLLEDDDLKENLYNHKLVKAITRVTYFDKALSVLPGVKRKEGKPSHIDSKIFAEAISDILIKESKVIGDKETLKSYKEKAFEGLQKVIKGKSASTLETIIYSVKGETKKIEDVITDVHKKLEVWFDNSMERLSVWYKQKTRLIIFFIALLFSVAFNIDSIMIAQSLHQDKALRQKIVEVAQKAIEDQQNKKKLKSANAVQGSDGKQQPKNSQDKDPIEQAIAEAKKLEVKLTKLGLPFGWNYDASQKEDLRGKPTGIGWLFKIIGILITSIAVSMGASFWFDALNKLVSLRKPLAKEKRSMEKTEVQRS